MFVNFLYISQKIIIINSMKKFLICLVFICTLSPAFCNESMLDYDMDFIDNPFKNQKPITQQQFDQTVNQMTTPRKGLIQKFRDWLERNNPENDPALKNYKSDISGELGMSAKEISNSKPNLVLAGAIMDSYGRTIPSGHYQVTFSKKDNIKLINLMQGSALYGSIKAHDTKDNWHENMIIYARIVYPTSNVAKIIYSNLDECVEGFARITEPI